MQKIAILGAGGFGREVKMLIDHINEQKQQWQFIGFYDDTIPLDTIVNNYPVLGNLQDVNNVTEEIYLAIGIGIPSVKKKVIDKITNPLVKYPTLIHPTVVKGSDNVYIGEGSTICAGCLITIDINIGKHVILNLGCTVGHDTIIQDYCSFMPSVNISGEVTAAEGVYVGTGAKIINQVEIGTNTIIGAGAVVSKSLPANCTAVGIPAKPIKYHS